MLSRLESISGNCMMPIAREHKLVHFYGWSWVTDLTKWELSLEKCPRSLLKPWKNHQYGKMMELNRCFQLFFCWKMYGEYYRLLLVCYWKKLIFHRRCRFKHLYQVLFVKQSLPGTIHKEVYHKSLHRFIVSCNYLRESIIVRQFLVFNRLKHICL